MTNGENMNATNGVEADESPSIAALAGALAKAQGAFKAAPKSSNNPFFSSKYADLASVMGVVREPLSVNGLAVTQRLTNSTDGVIITTMLMHGSGEWIRDRLSVRIEPTVSKDGKKQAWIQAFGSAVTYARRYALSSMLGVAADDDDDGNEAAGAGAPGRRNTSAPPAMKAPPQQMGPPSQDPDAIERALVAISEAQSPQELQKLVPGLEKLKSFPGIEAARAAFTKRTKELAAQ